MTKTKKPTRMEGLRLAAQRRASIIADINLYGRPATMDELLASAPSEDFDTHLPVAKFKAFVYAMKTAGTLNSTTIVGEDGKSVVAYFPTSGKMAVEEIVRQKKAFDVDAPMKHRSTKKGCHALPADLKIDIIKATGKVQLQINGLVIEIGVV